MTPNDILRMALEAGLRTGDNQPGRYRSAGVSVGVTESDLLAFADLVAAAEREACAKVCEQQAPAEPNCVWDAAYKHVVSDCAAAIRARGEGMSIRLRNLKPGAHFILKRTGERYQFLGHKRDTTGGTQYVVRRSGFAKPTTLHHSCHVELLEDAK